MNTAILMTADAVLEDENVYCEYCGVALTDAEINDNGERCAACHAATHFACRDCGDTFDNDEASAKCKSRCETCQATKDDAELEQTTDALKDEARELLETLCDDGDLEQLRKAVAALKRLQPKR